MNIKSKIWLGSLALCTLIPLHANDPLVFWLADSAPFWNWDGPTFMKEARPHGFRWTAENQSASATPLRENLFEKSVYEAVVRFKDGSPTQLMASYFNRGDSAKELTEEEFQAMVRELSANITKTIRVQSRRGNNTSRRTDIKDASLIWQRPKIQYELSYSHTNGGPNGSFRAEYIRLVVKEFSTLETPSYARQHVNPNNIRSRVVRDAATGDVWIDNIPMVDQGPKGYCAAATSERILRYFGQEVDQHQVAQIANTTSRGGTSPDELKKALQAVGRQYGFSFRMHQNWDFGDFRKEMESYNKLARKRETRPVALPGRGGVWNIGALYGSVDPDTWMELKTGQTSDFRKFEEKIKKYVNAGCPLAWSVTLGLYPEQVRVGSGGHLRMIIGYNTQNRQIIFSDTWGLGHEKKHMSIEQAYAITKSMFSLEPKGLRL